MPRERWTQKTFSEPVGMSQRCQDRTHASQQKVDGDLIMMRDYEPHSLLRLMRDKVNPILLESGETAAVVGRVPGIRASYLSNFILKFASDSIHWPWVR
jgi:hypothetical protein